MSLIPTSAVGSGRGEPHASAALSSKSAWFLCMLFHPTNHYFATKSKCSQRQRLALPIFHEPMFVLVEGQPSRGYRIFGSQVVEAQWGLDPQALHDTDGRASISTDAEPGLLAPTRDARAHSMTGLRKLIVAMSPCRKVCESHA